MKLQLRFGKKYALCVAAVSLIFLAAGCPSTDAEYDLGYAAGFAQDDEYWQGFDDSYDTLTGSPILYQGSDIPIGTESDYDEGYWDGVWYAYNDGYFVSYDYAFTVGFSEGYDAAFHADYLEFLEADDHIEYDNGGWGDGYNDGFSEGRIFGANDYEQGLTFNWLDAMDDYRSGTDLYFEEIDLGTGVYGPVYLYEYGTDPAAKNADATNPSAKALRNAYNSGKAHTIEARTLTQAVQTALTKTPTTTSRMNRALSLTTTWLQRIQAYENAAKNDVSKLASPLRKRAVQK